MRTLSSLILLAVVVIIITNTSFAQNATNYLVSSLPGIPQNVNYSTYAGLSSLFFEIGPWRLIDNQTLRSANESWNQYANLLFAGESYAGTLISYIATAILGRNNLTSTSNNLKYNLQGIAIGNGWIDPRTQYTAQYTYALSNNLIGDIYKLLVDKQLELCLQTLRNSTTVRVKPCEQTFGLIVNGTQIGTGNNATCINKYDIRDRSSIFPACGDDWPYSLPTLQAYLNRRDVTTAIHANAANVTWVGCNTAVSNLLFNDDRSGPAFDNLTTTPWTVNNALLGRMISERNLTYVVVYNSSRMVPADQPRIRDIMYRFMGLDQRFLPS
ncbi:8916_t:CDS:10 [Cetraspora pellucida]|uniref:Pheromone-processing carboxypeptidase KEX1 n=1 Tax=Cetraspora pellucida TaxID=1433469 RepID=A0A9N9GC76_9GLOM|nr:8916_t:CDS:10 [Cetraspora pellucida]